MSDTGLTRRRAAAAGRYVVRAVACSLWACTVIVAAPAHAADADTSAATLSIGRNVHVAGGDVRTGAAVAGDFSAAGGRVVVEHPVGADATLAGGSVQVRAPVGDDVRAAGGDVDIASTVGGDLYAAGGNVALGGSVARDASLAGGRITIDGRIAGRLRAAARDIVINGEIAGDAQLNALRIELGPRAKIGGVLRYRSAQPLQRAEGTTIAGGAVARSDDDDEDDRLAAGPHGRGHGAWHDGLPGMSTPFWFGSVLGFAGLLVVAALFALLLPGFSARAAEAIRSSPWRALGLGFAVLVGVPLLALLLVLTLLGIPLGIAVIALYPVLLLIGFVAGVLFVARHLHKAMRGSAGPSPASTIGFAALALLVLMLLGALPFVGALLLAGVTVAGLGACVLALVRRTQPAPA